MLHCWVEYRDRPSGVRRSWLDLSNGLKRSGILVQIPRPEPDAMRELIVADRRRDGTGNLEAAEDRERAAFLVEAMAQDRPDELAEACETTRGTRPR